jgi:hypothetical protein
MLLGFEVCSSILGLLGCTGLGWVFVCDAGVGQSEVVIVVEEVLKCPPRCSMCPSIAAHQGHWDPQDPYDPYDPPKSPYNKHSKSLRTVYFGN